MALKAYRMGTDDEVFPGDQVENPNSGRIGILVNCRRAARPGRDGSVFVYWPDDGSSRRYYDHVFGLDVQEAS
jgi:hypothetical protein